MFVVYDSLYIVRFSSSKSGTKDPQMMPEHIFLGLYPTCFFWVRMIFGRRRFFFGEHIHHSEKRRPEGERVLVEVGGGGMVETGYSSIWFNILQYPIMKKLWFNMEFRHLQCALTGRPVWERCVIIQ